MLHFAKLMKTFTLGPFNPSINVFRWLERLLQKYIPPDAHQWANGRLAVATTRLTDGKHTLMSEFQSKEDVVQVSLLLQVHKKNDFQETWARKSKVFSIAVLWTDS